MKAGHPMDAKKALAGEIVRQFHGAATAVEAGERWVRKFSERRLDDSTAVPTPVAPTEGEEPLARILVREGLCVSNKEAQRKIQEGAVSLDGEKVADPQFRLRLSAGDSLLVKVGKLNFQKWTVTVGAP
jgi:tyrosyl-tRNA synthetase